MTYIDHLNFFNRWLRVNYLPGNAILLFYRLLALFNEAGWPESIQVDNYRLMSMVDTRTERVAISARDKLVDCGFIQYSKGKKKCPNTYFLTDYTPQKVSENDSVFDSESSSVSGSDSVSKTVSHIKTKNKTKTNNTPNPPSAEKMLSGFLPEYGFAKDLSAKIIDWVAYKQERNDEYKEQGLKALLTIIQKNALKYGDNAVIDLIDQSMSNGWKGIIWDKLSEKKPQNAANYAPGERQLDADEIAAIRRMMGE